MVCREEAKYDPPDNAKELEETGDGASFASVFDHIKINDPSLNGFDDLSVGQYLKETDWTAPGKAKSVEQFWKNGKHYAYCTGHGRKRQPIKVYTFTLF